MVIERKKLFFKTADIILDDNAEAHASSRRNFGKITIVSHRELALSDFVLIKKGQTGVIDLKKNDEELLASFNKTTRNEIRRTFDEENLKFVANSPLQTAFELYVSFEKSISRAPFPLSHFVPAKAFLAYERDEPIAGIFVYPSKPILRIRSIFSSRRTQNESSKNIGFATRRLVYEICQWGRENGYTGLDLSSINLNNPETKNIAAFKMMFNPKVVPEYTYEFKTTFFSFLQNKAVIIRDLFSIKKFKNIFTQLIIFIQCIAFYLSRGTATKVPASFKSIAIVQTAKIGDMVCTTPMFRAVKKHRPGVMLHIIGNKSNEEILKGNTDIDAYHACESVNDFVTILRKIQPEVLIFTGYSFEALARAFLAGIPTIITPTIYDPKRQTSQTVLYGLLSNFVITVEQFFHKYIPSFYLKLLEPISVFENDTTKKLVFENQALKKVEGFFQNSKSPYIGISPSAGLSLKEWEASKFTELIKKIHKAYGGTFFVLGGNKSDKNVEQVISGLGAEIDNVNLSGNVSLEELKAVISKLDLVISPDSGPIYIAEAFNVATVDIVGPIDETEQPPKGPRNIIVIPPRDEAAISIVGFARYDKNEAIKQAAATSVDQVFGAVKVILDTIVHER